MKFKALKLHTENLAAEREFYHTTLGLPVIDDVTDQFTVEVGWSKLTFQESPVPFKYHYCFLIPSNKLDEALTWTEQRTTVINIEGDKKKQFFDDWNAESFYFFDASGNIVEFIVRYDLKNETEEPFDSSQILCVNEMGLPTKDVADSNQILEENLGTSFYKGDQQRFGTNGSAEGIFLLPNYTVKETWFPTSIALKPLPFEATIENGGNSFQLKFEAEKLLIAKS